MAPTSILIVEDEQVIRDSLCRRLTREGMHASEAADGARARELLERTDFDVVLVDHRLPDTDGLTILREIKSRLPATVVIVVTAFSTVDIAAEALRLGANDFITKPFNQDEIVLCIRRALEAQRLRDKARWIQSDVSRRYRFEALIGRSPAMVGLKETVRSVAASPARTVLLEGASGTGKDFVAKIIHYNSPRSQQPFVNITCTAIAETLLESELFGHERGAFTDARELKKGLFEIADGGTIFLDEIGDMPVSLQGKLLRFLEELTFRRVGGTKDLTVDVQVISATNQEIRDLTSRGRFRADLFYRLNSLTVVLPPLKDRAEDIPLLAEHFVDDLGRTLRVNVKGLADEAMERLVAYDWPGNVRELRNVIERAMVLGRGEYITASDISVDVGPTWTPVRQCDAESLLGPDGVDLRDVERRLVTEAIERTNGNQTRAARLLRISRDQLRYRLEKFGLLPGRKRTPGAQP